MTLCFPQNPSEVIFDVLTVFRGGTHDIGEDDDDFFKNLADKKVNLMNF